MKRKFLTSDFGQVLPGTQVASGLTNVSQIPHRCVQHTAAHVHQASTVSAQATSRSSIVHRVFAPVHRWCREVGSLLHQSPSTRSSGKCNSQRRHTTPERKQSESQEFHKGPHTLQPVLVFCYRRWTNWCPPSNEIKVGAVYIENSSEPACGSPENFN